jgi:sortase A
MIELVAAVLVVVVFVAAVLATRKPAAAPTAPPPDVEGLPPVVAFLRRHAWARRGLSLASVALLIGAVGMLGYPFYTNLYQSRIQNRLDNQLVSPELQQAYRDRQVGTGDALTRIRIPAINVDVVVVEGTTASALRAGAGHYPQTPLPCEQGNVGIAGHRTTYGKPFHNLDLLKAGDDIILETPIGECTYKVAKAPFVVSPSDVSVVAPTPDSSLTLTTCHPKGSAAHRLVIRATLQGPAASA